MPKWPALLVLVLGCVPAPERTRAGAELGEGGASHWRARVTRRFTLDPRDADLPLEVRLDDAVGLVNRSLGCALPVTLFRGTDHRGPEGMFRVSWREGARVTPRPVAEPPLTFEYETDLHVVASAQQELATDLTVAANGARVAKVWLARESLDQLARWSCTMPIGEPADEQARQQLRELADESVITFEPEAPPSDVAPDYATLFADGRLDIDVYFAWAPPYGAYWAAMEIYHLLLAHGFAAPAGVATFSAYAHDSPPLTRTIRWGGRDVRIEVRLVYGRKGAATDYETAEGAATLTAMFRESLRQRDVIAYVQRTPPVTLAPGAPLPPPAPAGIRLTDPTLAPAGLLPLSALSSMELARGRPQVLLFDGVMPYPLLRALERNASKPEARELDVLSCTEPSDVENTLALRQLLGLFVRVDAQGALVPATYRSLMWETQELTNGWSDFIYGTHFYTEGRP